MTKGEAVTFEESFESAVIRGRNRSRDMFLAIAAMAGRTGITVDDHGRRRDLVEACSEAAFVRDVLMVGMVAMNVHDMISPDRPGARMRGVHLPVIPASMIGIMADYVLRVAAPRTGDSDESAGSGTAISRAGLRRHAEMLDRHWGPLAPDSGLAAVIAQAAESAAPGPEA